MTTTFTSASATTPMPELDRQREVPAAAIPAAHPPEGDTNMRRITLKSRVAAGAVGPDRYGDPSAMSRATTSSDSPPLGLPKTAAEIDPAPADLGPCPTCGHDRPNPINTFATGSRSHPSLHVHERQPTDEPDPDGPDGLRSRQARGFRTEES
jgi:hypothetical protein